LRLLTRAGRSDMPLEEPYQKLKNEAAASRRLRELY
jgi:hypothetical protein